MKPNEAELGFTKINEASQGALKPSNKFNSNSIDLAWFVKGPRKKNPFKFNSSRLEKIMAISHGYDFFRSWTNSQAMNHC
jgi:hypothetical protein